MNYFSYSAVKTSLNMAVFESILVIYISESELVILQQILHLQNCCFLFLLMALQSSTAGWCLEASKEGWGVCLWDSPWSRLVLGAGGTTGIFYLQCEQSVFYEDSLSDPTNPSTIIHIHHSQGLVFLFLHYPKLFIVLFVYGVVCV